MKGFTRMDDLLKRFVEQGTNPVERFAVAYMHNMRPNEELYHHHRVRAVINGIML